MKKLFLLSIVFTLLSCSSGDDDNNLNPTNSDLVGAWFTTFTDDGSTAEQTFTFQYVTECTGASCLFGELTNPEPQTMVFYVILGVLLLYAARRGRQQPAQHFEAFIPDKETEQLFEEESTEMDDSMPEPVIAQDEDDDLELLEELDDI